MKLKELEELDIPIGIYQTLIFICPNCNEGIRTDVKSHGDIVCGNCGYQIYIFGSWTKRFTDTLNLLPKDIFCEYEIMEK
jgi:DNA-directed RNA polymerase subunit RPC12/RpoP